MHQDLIGGGRRSQCSEQVRPNATEFGGHAPITTNLSTKHRRSRDTVAQIRREVDAVVLSVGRNAHCKSNQRAVVHV
jgi:hypothetical protein